MQHEQFTAMSLIASVVAGNIVLNCVEDGSVLVKSCTGLNLYLHVVLINRVWKD